MNKTFQRVSCLIIATSLLAACSSTSAESDQSNKMIAAKEEKVPKNFTKELNEIVDDRTLEIAENVLVYAHKYEQQYDTPIQDKKQEFKRALVNIVNTSYLEGDTAAKASQLFKTYFLKEAFEENSTEYALLENYSQALIQSMRLEIADEQNNEDVAEKSEDELDLLNDKIAESAKALNSKLGNKIYKMLNNSLENSSEEDNIYVSTGRLKDGLNLRQAPSAESPLALPKELPNGTALKVISKQGNWYKVFVIGKDVEGWVNSTFTSITAPTYKEAYAAFVEVYNDTLVLREGAEKTYPKIAELENGTELQVYDESDGWYYVHVPSINEYGWVHSYFVTRE